MPNTIAKILWVDDEITLLRPHIIFLERKGYEVATALSGSDCLAMLEQESYDLLFLDEHMPGLSGIETLSRIQQLRPEMPIVMVTKSEEEELMHQAIGGKIADFLIKPVNPNQLLLTLKKLLQSKSIIGHATLQSYRERFMQLSDEMARADSIDTWQALYRKLAQQSIDIATYSPELGDMMQMQMREAEQLFSRFVTEHYASWMKKPETRPLMSMDLFSKKIFPMLDAGEKIFFVLIDNFRYDQWLAVKDLLAGLYEVQESMYTSILPTATQYARNAIFSGLMPCDIASMFPELWVDEESEEGKNINEEPLIRTQLERFRKRYDFSYHKVYETRYGARLLGEMEKLKTYPLNVIVLNFVDMLSHARTESKMIRELAHDEAAYRSLTRSWFQHSTTMRLFEKMAEMGYKVVLTTDHGNIRVKDPVKIIGDRNTSTNLRYKLGKNLSFNRKEAYVMDRPQEFGLPQTHLSDKFVFCYEDNFFAYPNNYNYYVPYYRDTFQHGGISMAEMLIPFITLQPK